jgi:LmbE family N-acetylglucosaminyl deacetylase
MDVLCFAAHPDDETVFAGGTLARLARAGIRAGVLWATRGEGGEAGEPPLCARAELGAVREAEARCAVRALGCGAAGFLGYLDPDVGPQNELFPYAQDEAEAAARLTDRLRALRPDAILTHGSSGEYGHPAHRLSHRIGLAAARRAGVPAVYTFSAFFEGHPRLRSANRDDPADFVIRLGAALERKAAAYECHRTQHALFLRRPSQEAGHPVALRETVSPVESFRRAYWNGAADPVWNAFAALAAAEG